MADSAPNPSPQTDERWMSQALALAQEAIGLASPNPTVGCVLVKDGRCIGAGAHEYERRDHAEIVALREAGELVRGATAYVTLEPCSHHGRTGPCSDALIAAGVARVVVATADANPQVHGRGIERLRKAGIEVSLGILEQPAQRLNDAFAKYIRTGFPHVTLKAAMTLDGRTAPPPSSSVPGEISWITGVESREQVHRLRHSVDAVVTGIGTVLDDDPLLTDRSGLRRRRPLMRVVLDSSLRLPLTSKLVRSANNDVLVFNPRSAEDRAHALEAAGVLVQPVTPSPSSSRMEIADVLQALGERQITSVLVEAGSRMNTSFLNASVVDRLYLFYAPWFLGSEAQPLLDSAPPQRPSIHDFALHRFGKDFAFECWLGDPWRL